MDMTDYLEKNLHYLRLTNPPLADRVEKAPLPEGAEIRPAKNGQPTLILNGITFHSRINPGSEGRKMAAAAKKAAAKAGKVPGFFGLGLGWHVLALAGQVEVVTVVEPDPGMVRLALTWLDFGPLWSKIRLIVTTDDMESPNGLVLMPHPPTTRAHQAAYQEWTRFFDRVFQAADETVDALRDQIGHLSGTAALLNGLDDRDKLGVDDLVHLVEKRGKPLTETEIYILLLKELQL